MGDISLVTGKMTSMEISRLTGKDHSKVCRDIRKMLKELEIGDATFGDTYRDGQNKAQKMYSLDKRLSLVLAT